MNDSDPARTVLLVLIAALLLGWLGTPYAGYQLDDLFISLAFAEQWVETGVLAWTTGERVEGYSNFGLVALAALGIRFGLPAAALARCLAFVGGVGVLFSAAFLGPGGRKGALALLGLACWMPLAYWSTVALETTVAAWVLGTGWACVVAARARGRYLGGLTLLVLGSLLRPEGLGLVALGLLARPRLGWQWSRTDWGVLGVLFALIGYHLLRIAHFGAVLPTPFLVKISGVSGGATGLLQLGGDLAAASGLVVLILVVFRPPARQLPWVLAPVLLHAGLLLRADGDWMGMSRMLLPGMTATFLSAVALTSPSPLRPHYGLVLPVIALCALLEPGWPEAGGLRIRSVAALSEPGPSLSRAWMTPFRADLTWAVTHLPDGAVVEIADVGLLGQVPGVSVLDQVGLVDRVRAENQAWGLHHDQLDARHHPGPEQVTCVRYTTYRHEGTPSVPESIARAFPYRYSVRDFGLASDWLCREALLPVPPERIRERWQILHDRYPMQDRITLELGAARLAAGHMLGDLSGRTVEGVPIETATAFPAPRWPRTHRGVPLYAAGMLASRLLSSQEARTVTVRLDTDDAAPDGVPVRIGWEPACGARYVGHTAMGPEDVSPPVPACAGPVELRVILAPHEDVSPRDRNLYVDLAFR